MANKRRELIKNTFLIAMGKIGTQFVAFFLLPLYTHFLSPSQFGFVDLLTTYFTLLIPAITIQLEMALFRFLVDSRNDVARSGVVISNAVFMAVVLFIPALVGFLGISFAFRFEYRSEILLAAVSILFANLLLQIARGMGKNRQFAVASLIIGLSTALSAIVLVGFAGMKVDGVLVSIALANFSGALYLSFKIRIGNYIRVDALNRKTQYQLASYSMPLVPNGAAWWIINASDRTIITIMISSAANGIYAVSSKYAAIFSALFGIFNMSWTESASMHIDADDRDSFFSDVYNAALRLFGSIGLCLIACIPFIFPWLVSESFDEAYYYVPILVIGALFNAIVGLYSAIYIAKKLTKQVMNTSLSAACVSILLTIGLIPFFGLYAAAGATALAFFAMAIFRHFDVKKYVTISYDRRLFYILTGLYVLVAFLYHQRTFVSSVLSAAVACVATIVLNRRAMRVVAGDVMGVARKKKKTF